MKARIWADGDSEPSGWDVDTTDGTYNTAGHIGLQKGANTNTIKWRHFGVGTNGDTAPTSAPSAGAPTLGTASAINVTATGATPRLTATW